MQLNKDYQRDEFLKFLEEEFLTDFKKDVRPVGTNGLSSIKKADYLGQSNKLDLQIFEFIFEGSPNKRVALTKDAFSVMRSVAIFQALAVFHSPDNKDWRLSLLTAIPEPTKEGKVSRSYSNPKRLSFFLGPNAKINTPTKFLISKGKIADLEDLKNRFSIEVVNKEFYKEISQAFTKLVGGLLQLPSTQDKSRANLEFAVRLIGRIIFCWFLREKKSQAGLALMPKELLSLEAVTKNKDYYHKILEPIFFEVLNKPVKSRIDDFIKEPFSSVPYLNGGLFSPQENDYYKRPNGDFQSQHHNTLIIPDNWFTDFFEILETYNFTIDENTSYDEELSIDPEMLGRIFENLLAEINPETGESARKSTGSYYTPRIIVNYMADESLLLYLKEQTEISEGKLRAIISYDLSDDAENPVTDTEKEKIIDALEKVKILDPACGSGAFPMGALQKIVFILQQTDPDGQLWFRKQIKNTSPEIRRVVEREFAHKNFDYIRKLGIIRENIYGVDIQPIAIEISRLRCFLTLVVDERIQDESENRGIEPLPNLDFKFVTANSLIGLPKIDTQTKQIDMLDDREKIYELKSVRDDYFNASGIEREQLKTEFVTQQKKLVDQLIKEHGYLGIIKAELTQKLTDWEPFSHKAASWFDPEWMFGVKDGFDIVIANPPYGADIDSLVPYFRKIYLEVIKNYSDIFKIFFSFGIKSLVKNGVLVYITPNVYLTQPRYKDLRSYLHKFALRKIINLGLEVFEGTVVPTCVTLLQNSTSDEGFLLLNAAINSKYKGNLNNMESFFVSFKQVREMPDMSFYLTNTYDKDVVILDKIMELKDAGIQYHRSGIGLKNKGGNDLFERIVSSDQKYFSKAVPIWYGKLIRDYYIAPVTNEYFNLDFKNILKSDESVSFSKEAFDKEEKIVWRQTAPYLIATIDRLNRWFRNTIQCGWIKVEYKEKVSIEYLLALLNSTYIRYVYQKTVNESSGRTFPQVKITHVKKIPIKFCDQRQQLKFVEKVKDILNLTERNDYLTSREAQKNVLELNNEIDEMVYKLYNLTPEEVEIVEQNKK